MKTETLRIRRRKPSASRRVRLPKTRREKLKIRNVLVPLDFSSASHAALRFALPLLRHFGPNLHLVHVLPADAPRPGMADLPVVVPDVQIARRPRRGVARAEDHALKRQSGHLHLRRGNPFTEICNLAREVGIDLIVISTRGNTGLKHLALGSTAERVIRYSPCPVLVVRDTARANKGTANGEAVPHTFTISRILVPTDFSKCSMKSLTYAKRLAKEFGANLTLLHSIALQYYVTSDEYTRHDLPLLVQRSEKTAQRNMRDLITKTQRDGVKVNSSMAIGHAGQQICACAEAEHADIIVTSTHGYTGLKHMLIGSTAEYVVRHASCPVLVVPSLERPAGS